MKVSPRFGFMFMAACTAAAVTIMLSTPPWRTAGPLFAGFTGLLFAAFAGLVYILPSVIAGIRGHRQLFPIVVVNILAGWLCIGWFVALVWSVAAFDSKGK